MKKISIYILMVILILSLTGCKAKKKLGEKTAEAIVEKIMEDSIGGKVDIDDGTVKIKGEDGEEITIGGTEWPTSDLAKSIPRFEAGKIVSVMEARDSLFIMIEEISEEDFTRYLEEIKGVFTKETYVMTTNNGVMYSAENDENIGLMLSYEKGVGFSIAVSQSDSEED